MPWGLRRYQQARHLHFITFSCYRRQSLLDESTRRLFERALEITRVRYKFYVAGYVVMPEHVHLLVSEPERETLATAIQALKQSVSRRKTPAQANSGLGRGTLNKRGSRFWEARYYDFNVFSERKRIDKLRYMHRNPVKRGLVERAEDWLWSSFRHYATGEPGVVEIESEWTQNARENSGIPPRLKKP